MIKYLIVLKNSNSKLVGYFGQNSETEYLTSVSSDVSEVVSPKFLIFEDCEDISALVGVVMKLGWKNFRITKKRIKICEEEIEYLSCVMA